MARVNVDILGISKLKWTGMGEFNSDDHYIYYCEQDSLRRNGVFLIVNKSTEMHYLVAISKTTEWSLFISKAKHSISRWSKPMFQPVMLKKLKLSCLWRPTRPFRTNTQKRFPLHYILLLPKLLYNFIISPTIYVIFTIFDITTIFKNFSHSESV